MRRLFPLLAVVVVVLAGCRAEAELGLDVESQGSGTFGFEIGVDDQLASLIESTGQSVDEIIGQLPAGATALEPRVEDGLTVYGFTRAFTNPDEAAALVAQGSDGFEAQASSFALSVADGGATLDATFDVPNATEQADQFGGLADSLADVFSASLRVHLPGEVVESNADRTLADGGLVWDIPLQGGVVDVQARSEAAGGGFPVVPVAVTVGVVGLGVGLWALSRRKPDGTAAIEAIPVPSAPTSVYGDVTTPAVFHETAPEQTIEAVAPEDGPVDPLVPDHLASEDDPADPGAPEDDKPL